MLPIGFCPACKGTASQLPNAESPYRVIVLTINCRQKLLPVVAIPAPVKGTIRHVHRSSQSHVGVGMGVKDSTEGHGGITHHYETAVLFLWLARLE